MCVTAPKRERLKLMRSCSHHFVTRTWKKKHTELEQAVDVVEDFCVVCGITPDRLRKWTRRALR